MKYKLIALLLAASLLAGSLTLATASQASQDVPVHRVMIPLVIGDDGYQRWDDIGPDCHWDNISKKPPKCWCTPLPTEPPDYVPAGCPGR